MKPKNEDRAEKLFARNFHSEDFVEFIHEKPCAAPRCGRRDIQCAHVDSTRGAGGRWFTIAPLCTAHHREQEGATDRFNAKYGVDLRDIAAQYACEWNVRQGVHP